MTDETSALAYPFTAEAIAPLRAGMRVSLNGLLFSGRDRFHKHLFEGGASPVPLRDGAIYHCGPVAVQHDGAWQIRAAGPTTSMREEPYMASIIEHYGVRIVIGKGGMGEATRRACKAFGCVYLHAVGGAASLIATCISDVRDVHFMREFGLAEAVWEMDVRDFEVVVAIDAQGRSLNDRVARSSRRALKKLL